MRGFLGRALPPVQAHVHGTAENARGKHALESTDTLAEALAVYNDNRNYFELLGASPQYGPQEHRDEREDHFWRTLSDKERVKHYPLEIKHLRSEGKLRHTTFVVEIEEREALPALLSLVEPLLAPDRLLFTSDVYPRFVAEA